MRAHIDKWYEIDASDSYGRVTAYCTFFQCMIRLNLLSHTMNVLPKLNQRFYLQGATNIIIAWTYSHVKKNLIEYPQLHVLVKEKRRVSFDKLLK